MSQVTILAMDLSKSTENSGAQSYSKDSGYSTNTNTNSNFSDVMAKHQQSESGNDLQKSGNSFRRKEQETSTERSEKNHSENKHDTQSRANVDDKANTFDEKITDNSETQVELANKDSANANTGQSSVSNNENQTDAGQDSGDKTVESFDIAKQLLSFIVASDGVSTKHSDPKLTENTKQLSESVYSDAQLKNNAVLEDLNLDGKGKTLKSSDKQINEGGSANNNRNHSLANVQLDKLSGDTASESSGEQVTNQETDQQAKVTQVNELLKSDKNSTAGTSSAIVDKGIAALAEQKNVVGENTVTINIDEKALAAQEVNQKELASQKTSEHHLKGLETALSNEDDLLASQTNAQAQSSKLDGANSENKPVANQNLKDGQLSENTAPSKDALKEISSEMLTANAERNTLEQKPAEVKITDNNTRAAERVINQATASVMQNNAQMGQGQSQSGESQLNQSQTGQPQTNEQVKTVSEEVIVDKKAAIANAQIDEKLTTSFIEQKVSQTIHNNEMNANILNQQTTFAEEQVIQNIVAKANADSMSVQSAKTAINIHSETIAIYRKDFSNAVKDKVMVMINQKIKQLEIRLDPPELGSMQVRLNLQNEQAAVNFVVQNQQAKEALEQNMDKLKEMLSQSGVDVGDANIEQRDQQTAEQDESENSRQGTDFFENDTIDEQTALSGANLYKASATGVDYYA